MAVVKFLWGKYLLSKMSYFNQYENHPKAYFNFTIFFWIHSLVAYSIEMTFLIFTIALFMIIKISAVEK